MAENTLISWANNTHNEWIGCTKVSAGCDNCYAEREQDHRYGRAKWGKGNDRYRTSEANRKKPFSWQRHAERSPFVCPTCTLPATARDTPGACHRCGTECVPNRPRVFTASLSDVFDEEVQDEWRHELFATIRKTPNLDWLVLTKRLAKMRRYVEWMLSNGLLPRNVWWGCSVEDQNTADRRVPELLKLRPLVGDAPLWLSIEPLIGPVDLSLWLTAKDECIYVDHRPVRGPDWCVVGGESGPNARPMHPDWARSLRDQCVAAGVAYHFKQWGEWTDYTHAGGQGWEFTQESEGKRYGVLTYRDGTKSVARFETRYPWTDPAAYDTAGPCMVRVGKKAAGRMLDGRTWDEFPRPR